MTEKISLNLGSGKNLLKEPNWINVDSIAYPGVDVVTDLDVGSSHFGIITQWPWADNSADTVLFNHSLEHLSNWKFVFKELYRVCAGGARIMINAPHPRHDDFIDDPTHVFKVTPSVLAHLSRRVCKMLSDQGAPNTPLAEILGVDFELVRTELVLDEDYRPLANDPAIQRLIKERNNVVKEYKFEIVCVKPERGEAK